MNNRKILFQKLVQNAWFLMGIPTERVGFYKGLHTTLKRRQHAKLNRPHHISFIGTEHYRTSFAPIITYWVNERMTDFSAGLNDVSEKTDVVWIFFQDPLSEKKQAELMHKCETEWKNKIIINHPANYNHYHDADCFIRLREAGVHVPRVEFDESDIGKTEVVYKQIGLHAKEKFFGPYTGERSGYRAYEFIDTRDANGVFNRYRAFYLLGDCLPTFVYTGRNPNMYSQTREHAAQVDALTEQEIRDVSKTAEVLGIDYFAVDLLRTPDGLSYIVDINIYPTVYNNRVNSWSGQKHYGYWPHFDWFFKDGVNAWQVLDDRLKERINAAI